MQAGNSIGGAISPGRHAGRGAELHARRRQGVRRATRSSCSPTSPRRTAPTASASKVVGLADAPGKRFVFSLFEAGEIWIADLSRSARAAGRRSFADIGRQPYDGLVTPDGRHYIAGLFGEDGLALLDLWHPERGVRRILDGYGRGEEKLPVYKMPHLRGWAVAGRLRLPARDRPPRGAGGRHARPGARSARIAGAGQPVFVIARPDGRQVWVNFALPGQRHGAGDRHARRARSCRRSSPGKAVLHMEFTPRGEAVWISRARRQPRGRLRHRDASRTLADAAGGQPERHLLHRARGADRVLMMARDSTRCAPAQRLPARLPAGAARRSPRSPRRSARARRWVLATLRALAARRRGQPRRRGVPARRVGAGTLAAHGGAARATRRGRRARVARTRR